MTLRVRGGALQSAIDRRLAALERDGFVGRLWARDVTLWSRDPAHHEVARHRLGWLDVAARMQVEAPWLRAFAREVAAEGFTRAVLLGMGGSSLAPEVFARTFGAAAGSLPLTVLDSTSPAAVRAVTATHDPTRTLFVVSSKSGGTIEVTSFEAHFYEWVREARHDAAGRSFVAITDPGTSLAELAKQRGYRRAFINPADIGGRYSALSFFGLVPAALLGLDLDALLHHAAAETERDRLDSPPAENPALLLGAALGELARGGRDKMTLVLDDNLQALGDWIEQLVAESTGKDGRGIVPVVGEPLPGPEACGDDRVFVAVTTGAAPAATSRRLDELERAGHAVIRSSLGGREAIGGEFLRWEVATAVAAAVLGVDPFDEPNVTEAKQATQAALAQRLATGRFETLAPAARSGDLAAIVPAGARDLAERLARGADPAGWAAALLSQARPGDYFAILAYLHATPARDRAIARLRAAANAAARVATTAGYGPRFLHSTGQLHKGGADNGVFLQLVADEGPDVPIPGRPHGFADLIAAQALGDFEVLARRGRRVLRVHLGADPDRTLEALVEAFAAASA
jgi:glucose-6-phosphate isomerase